MDQLDITRHYEALSQARTLTVYTLGLALNRHEGNSAALALDHVRRTLGARASGLSVLEKAVTPGIR